MEPSFSSLAVEELNVAEMSQWDVETTKLWLINQGAVWADRSWVDSRKEESMIRCMKLVQQNILSKYLNRLVEILLREQLRLYQCFKTPWHYHSGFRDIGEILSEHKIDGRVLMSMTEDDLLLPLLNIKIFGDIRRLSLLLETVRC